MENAEVRETLATIVRQQGQGIIDDTPRLQGLLKDLAGSARREINILMSAQRANVPQELLRTSGPTSITAQRLADRLQDDTGLSLDAARWAVETWGNAVGVQVAFESVESVDQSIVSSPLPTYSEPQAPISMPPSVPATTPLSSSQPHVSAPQPAQPALQGSQPTSFPQPQNWQPQRSRTPLVVAMVSLVVVALGGGGAFYFLKRGTSSTATTSGPPATTGLTSTTSGNGGTTSGPVGTDSGPTNSGATGATTGTTGTNNGGTPPPTTAIGAMEGGRFVASDGSYSFTPPEGWDMRISDTEQSVQWQNPEDENLGVMDLRVADAQGKTLDELAKSATETLKQQMAFNPLNTTDTTLASEPCKLVTGTIKGASNVEMMMALALSTHAGKTVVITMGAKKEAFGQAVPTLDASLASWSWR